MRMPEEEKISSLCHKILVMVIKETTEDDGIDVSLAISAMANTLFYMVKSLPERAHAETISSIALGMKRACSGEEQDHVVVDLSAPSFH